MIAMAERIANPLPIRLSTVSVYTTGTTGATGNLKKSFLTREKNDPRSHQSVAHPQSTIYCNRGINDDSEINHKRKPSP